MAEGLTHSYPLVSTLPSSLCDLGQVLGLLGLLIFLVINLSSQQDRYRPLGGNGGSERCLVLLQVTQRVSTRSGGGPLTAPHSCSAALAGTLRASWRKWALRASLNHIGPEQPLSPGQAGLRGSERPGSQPSSKHTQAATLFRTSVSPSVKWGSFSNFKAFYFSFCHQTFL